MHETWFVILALMLTAYAVLDGFDLGVGALLPWLCRTEEERQQARDSIGPVWNGNEVWLIAAGGAMFMAFPRLYAASFSGFYLALMLVLWLLILRGVGFEFRHANHSPLWTGLWDTVFSGASVLLAVLLGVAVGNVLRGVPLNAQGEFQGSFALMLNPFALLAGVLSLVTLCLHGAAFLAMKTEGALQERARKLSLTLWVGTAVLTVIFVVTSGFARPDFTANFARQPLLFLLPLLALAALVAIPLMAKREQDGRLFGATTLLIVSLLASAAAGLFPRLLPALGHNPQADLTIYNAASSPHSLLTALIMNMIGMIAVIAYTSYVYKIWSGKVKPLGY
ncbi:MAG: cytochrome d ubiquinol oxidase subunit II [Armatimonadota bacterium]|nr:cytochrome d ubiquinol oxidase subunit II [Armatimonadota bacterium]